MSACLAGEDSFCHSVMHRDERHELVLVQRHRLWVVKVKDTEVNQCVREEVRADEASALGVMLTLERCEHPAEVKL